MANQKKWTSAWLPRGSDVPVELVRDVRQLVSARPTRKSPGGSGAQLHEGCAQLHLAVAGLDTV
ncbi:hypothetical protein ACFWJV_30295 [Streptomyces rochei]|uniref:hypothetical protein n=1 Tax=Streptomyces rochei TaxID=1928 RepID=UPI003658896A